MPKGFQGFQKGHPSYNIYPQIFKNCLFCGKKFKTILAKFNRAHFCSKECYWQSMKEKKFTRRKETFKIKCQTCDRIFEVSPFFKNRKFCNRKCHKKFQKGKHYSPKTEFKKGQPSLRKGEKSSWWKGGITPLNKIIKKSTQYLDWRKKVFERDKYTCQKCKEKGGNLHPHHIKLFSQILKENNIKTLEQALACKELWDVKNGITLCFDCHRKIHNFKYIYKHRH